MALLVRGRAFFSPKLQNAKRLSHEKAVQSGLAITPSDIERLAQQGVAVSVPNADSFIYNNEVGWDIDPVYIPMILTKPADCCVYINNILWCPVQRS